MMGDDDTDEEIISVKACIDEVRAARRLHDEAVDAFDVADRNLRAAVRVLKDADDNLQIAVDLAVDGNCDLE